MLQYEQFEESVKQRLEQIYGEESRVVACDMRKNNGATLRGLSAYVPDSHVVPTIYPEEFYLRYSQGMPLGQVIQEIEDTLAVGYEADRVDVGYYKEFGTVQDTLRIKIINYGSNKAFLQEVPYRRMLDLAIVCYSHVPGDMPWHGTITVTHAHLGRWGVSQDELFARAQENNCRQDGWVLLEMGELLQDMQQDDDRVQGAKEDRCPDMYVLTSQSKVNGACAAWYPGALKQCSEVVQGDFYVLPSSIHELILVEMWNQDEEELLAMVREVNDEQLCEEEVLSYHVYKYCADEGYLMDIVTEEKVYM